MTSQLVSLPGSRPAASPKAVVDGWMPIGFCVIGPKGVVMCTKERQPYTTTAGACPTTIEVMSRS